MSFEVQKRDLKRRSLQKSLEKMLSFIGSSGHEGHQGLALGPSNPSSLRCLAPYRLRLYSSSFFQPEFFFAGLLGNAMFDTTAFLRASAAFFMKVRRLSRCWS